MQSDLIIEIGNADAFLALPSRLYTGGACPRDYSAESKLIAGGHILSKYFEFFIFTASRNGDAVSRCAVAIYPGDETAYLGFFDSADDESAASALFARAGEFARSKGAKRASGPVDASFWLGYRLKVNKFGKPPYFGEPCGLPWYQKLWEQNGYAVADIYASNAYVASSGYKNEKFIGRLAEFTKQGYVISPLSRRDWNGAIKDIYGMIMRLYADFPMFKHINEDDFIKHYSGLKNILDFSMVKLARYKGEPVGFFISVPDYGDLLNRKMDLPTLAKILLIKLRPRRYVMLYMGVDERRRGLGKAMTQTVIESLAKKRAESIGALIHQGKINERYAEDMITEKYMYLLFSKQLN